MQQKIILGVTGSIAAYKSIDLAKLLLSAGFDVIIVLTECAESFISSMKWRALFPNEYIHMMQRCKVMQCFI